MESKMESFGRAQTQSNLQFMRFLVVWPRSALFKTGAIISVLLFVWPNYVIAFDLASELLCCHYHFQNKVTSVIRATHVQLFLLSQLQWHI